MHTIEKPLTFTTMPRFLRGLGKMELQEVLSAGETRVVGPRQFMFRAEQPADRLFLLLAGRVIFYRLTPDGQKVLLARLSSGDVFGLGSLLSDPVNYIGDAETIRPCEFLVWQRARICQLAGHHPQLARNALGIVLHYLAAHADRLVDLVTCTAAQRLARALLHLGEETGTIQPTGVEIEATNEELSELAHVSSFTTSRLLNQWSREGIVMKVRGKVFIHTPEKLLVE